ncbi:4136_t:CDS:2 [Funneliformis caledonium]|uniref:4136_t:CDS:1 n=1 Tax=Funneliformis caledonium TaxID=1117310 RepID=A0A9N9C2Q7_9GLOM|nr:4136_t:CDS:2 [Funneliformis caledonium]
MFTFEGLHKKPISGPEFKPSEPKFLVALMNRTAVQSANSTGSKRSERFDFRIDQTIHIVPIFSFMLIS